MKKKMTPRLAFSMSFREERIFNFSKIQINSVSLKPTMVISFKNA